jgi:hypothetical protein
VSDTDVFHHWIVEAVVAHDAPRASRLMAEHIALVEMPWSQDGAIRDHSSGCSVEPGSGRTSMSEHLATGAAARASRAERRPSYRDHGDTVAARLSVLGRTEDVTVLA